MGGKPPPLYANDERTDTVLAKEFRVKNCLRYMGNILNTVYGIFEPNHIVHRYINVVFRNLKGTSEKTTGELSLTAPCTMKTGLLQTPIVTLLRRATETSLKWKPVEGITGRRKEIEESLRNQNHVGFQIGFTNEIPEDGSKCLWTIVKSKKLVKRKKRRPDVILIASRGDLPYARILRKINIGPTLSSLGNNAAKIRGTRRELRKTQDQSTFNYPNLVR